MSGSFSRRLAAAEAKAASVRRVYRFEPSGLDEAALIAWNQAEVAPAEAAGLDVVIYHWRRTADTGSAI